MAPVPWVAGRQPMEAFMKASDLSLQKWAIAAPEKMLACVESAPSEVWSSAMIFFVPSDVGLAVKSVQTFWPAARMSASLLEAVGGTTFLIVAAHALSTGPPLSEVPMLPEALGEADDDADDDADGEAELDADAEALVEVLAPVELGSDEPPPHAVRASAAATAVAASRERVMFRR